MNNINLITPPDILHNDSIQLLFVSPSGDLQKEIQKTVFSSVEDSLNVYIYEQPTYDKDNVNWLLNVFKQSDITIIDIDNCTEHCRDLLSYMIAKNKTYWLTNNQDSVYNNLSKNKIYTLDFLSNIGEHLETTKK